jgi:hypothetical protein
MDAISSAQATRFHVRVFEQFVQLYLQESRHMANRSALRLQRVTLSWAAVSGVLCSLTRQHMSDVRL